MRKYIQFSLRASIAAFASIAVIAVIACFGLYAWNKADPPPLRQLRSSGLAPAHYGMRDGNVAYLYFSGPDVQDLRPLSELRELELLYLRGTSVNDLTPLHSLDNLSLVDFSGTEVSDEQVNRLKDALPQCDIRR